MMPAQPAAPQIVQCKQCMKSQVIPAGADPHLVFECGCCTEDHHHGQEANACPRTHDGPCWQGPLSGPKPDGCTVCRPLIFAGNAAVGPVAGMGF
jgi:hypothetical protein